MFLGPDASFDVSQVIFVLTANTGEDLDASIVNRANKFHFDSLSSAAKKEILRRRWKGACKDAHVPTSLGITDGALEVMAAKRADDPGVRQLLETDLDDLVNWLHSRKDADALPEQVNAQIVKRVVEQTWVDVGRWHDDDGFVADVHLGSIGLVRARHGNAVFSALGRTWRVHVDGRTIAVSLASGAPIGGYAAIAIRGANDRNEHTFVTNQHIVFSASQSITSEMSPPLPEQDAAWKRLLTGGEALNLRLVVLSKDYWLPPKGLLRQGLLARQTRTGRYDV